MSIPRTQPHSVFPSNHRYRHGVAPDGSTPLDPAAYGFQVMDTGSGCTALYRDAGEGRIMMLTDNGGADTPDLEDWGSSLVGLQNADGEELACVSASELSIG